MGGALAHGPQKDMKEEVHPAILGKRNPSMNAEDKAKSWLQRKFETGF